MIKKIWNKLIGRERLIITPKGDYLINHIEDKIKGKNVSVEEYDKIISSLIDEYGFPNLESILVELQELKGGKYV